MKEAHKGPQDRPDQDHPSHIEGYLSIPDQISISVDWSRCVKMAEQIEPKSYENQGTKPNRRSILLEKFRQ